MGFVGSSKFNVFQASSTCQQIHLDIEDVVRLVIRQVHLEHGCTFSDAMPQVELLYHLHEDAHTAA